MTVGWNFYSETLRRDSEMINNVTPNIEICRNRN